MHEINMRGIKFNVDDSSHMHYWVTVEDETWQPWIFPIYDRLLDREHCCIDFGAWVGGTTLYSAVRAGHCYAFEPDPIAFELLQRNVSCNPELSITLVNAAVWTETGTVTMCSEAPALGRSDTSILLHDLPSTAKAKSITFADFRSSLSSVKDSKLLDVGNCNLMKFDIEGAEFTVLEDMLDFFEEVQPSIIVSAHWPRVDNPREQWDEIKSMLGFYKHFYTANILPEERDVMPGNVLITNEEWN